MPPGTRVVSTALVRVVRSPRDSAGSTSSMQRMLFYSGVSLATVGGCLTVASKRPTRHGLGLMGAGGTLALINSPFFSPLRLSALVLFGTAVTLGSIHFQDEQERQIQRVFEQGRMQLPFPDNVRFDDGGPDIHAVSRPQAEILVSFVQAFFGAYEGRERIRVKIAGYTVSADGHLEPSVGYAYASRSNPWQEFTIDRVDMASNSEKS